MSISNHSNSVESHVMNVRVFTSVFEFRKHALCRYMCRKIRKIIYVSCFRYILYSCTVSLKCTRVGYRYESYKTSISTLFDYLPVKNNTLST